MVFGKVSGSNNSKKHETFDVFFSDDTKMSIATFFLEVFTTLSYTYVSQTNWQILANWYAKSDWSINDSGSVIRAKRCT